MPLRRISPTKDTPEIILDPQGNIKITGRSVKADPYESASVVNEWIDSYLDDPADVTNVEISLEYINTLNLKAYVALLKKIEKSGGAGRKCVINWYYEEGDDDILEKGEYISLSVGKPFNFIRKPDCVLEAD